MHMIVRHDSVLMLCKLVLLVSLDVFAFVRTLLEHGADPTARNDRCNTPLAKLAQNIWRNFWSHNLCFNAEAATEVYSGLLT